MGKGLRGELLTVQMELTKGATALILECLSVRLCPEEVRGWLRVEGMAWV